ncbi:XK-related protein 6 [Aethina tumida]|uniref:XK-related protein 6 n=1 Tax=Aethina tumida TaxID=116153 RepID=UPI00214849CF|nr:XK-related protein 6 [Aethina tumida]
MAEDCTVVKFSRDPSLARIENLKQTDNVDKFAENEHNFGVFYVTCIALSIITYVLDIALACILLYVYYVNQYRVDFALTVSFMLLSALFTTAISLRWYIVDHDDPSLGRTSVFHWVVRIVFLLLQLSPLLRYIDTLIYGIKSKIAGATDNENQQTTLYRRMLDEDTNGALLRLFHCFLHSAPQAVIQLMILLRHMSSSDINKTRKELSTDVAVIQSWTVLAALMSIAWSLTTYHRSVRYARDDKDKIKWGGIVVAFSWQLMSALSRVLALSLLASIFPAWMGCVCALHWVVMSVWLTLTQHNSSACTNRCEEFFLSAALGLAYVLAFISPRDGPTRYVYLAYYLVCFMENTGALVVWCISSNSNENPFLYYGAASAQVIAFLLAIAFLIIYYKYCHPSLKNRSKIPSLDSSECLEIDKPGYSRSYNVRTRS